MNKIDNKKELSDQQLEAKIHELFCFSMKEA